MKREKLRSKMKQLNSRMVEARDEFYRNRRRKGFMAFWWLDPLHYLLVLEVAIADASSKSINFETIVKLLPGSMGSRSTVATVLDDFVARGYMCKKVGKDKRERVYTICPDSMVLMNEWFTKRDFSLRAVS
jgi:hypothetical protein